MGKKTINIEIRIQKTGSVFSWEVFLENTNYSSRISDGWAYNKEKNYYYATLDHFPIEDESLDVYLGCEGKKGGETTCTIIIDEKEQKNKATCKNTDPNYAHEAYSLKK